MASTTLCPPSIDGGVVCSMRGRRRELPQPGDAAGLHLAVADHTAVPDAVAVGELPVGSADGGAPEALHYYAAAYDSMDAALATYWRSARKTRDVLPRECTCVHPAADRRGSAPPPRGTAWPGQVGGTRVMGGSMHGSHRGWRMDSLRQKNITGDQGYRTG